MFVSLCLFLLMLIPTELARPGRTATAAEMKRAIVYLWVNHWDAAASFLGNIMVFDARVSQVAYQLTLPVVFPILILGVLFTYGPRGLRLEAGVATRLQAAWRSWTTWKPAVALKSGSQP
jgi:hypothetical protein